MRALSSFTSSSNKAAVFFASSSKAPSKSIPPQKKKTTTKASLSFSKRPNSLLTSSSSKSSRSSNFTNTTANIERGVLVVSSASPSTSAARGAVVTVTRWKGTTYEQRYTNKYYCPTKRRALRRVENASSSECDEDHQKVSLNQNKSGLGDFDDATKKNTNTDVLARALELDQKVTGKGASRVCCFFLSFFFT